MAERYSRGILVVLRDINRERSHRSVVKDLARLKGPEAQILRLLLWATEEMPELRKELFTQWLLGRDESPEEKELLSTLEALAISGDTILIIYIYNKDNTLVCSRRWPLFSGWQPSG